MPHNPYEPPKSGYGDTADNTRVGTRIVRRGVLLIPLFLLCPVWLTITYLRFFRIITELEEGLAFVGLFLAIALASFITAQSSFVQRRIFVPDADIQTIRPRLWGFAALWIFLSIVSSFQIWLEFID